MGLRDMRGLRVPINHPPAPLEVPQRPLRSDTNTSSPSDSPQTPQSPRVHLILQTSQSPSMPRKPLEGPQRAPQTPPITPQRPPPAPIAPQSPRGNQEPLGDPPSPTSPSNLHVDKARGHARLAQQEVGQGEVASPHGQVQRCQAAFGVLGERHGSGGGPTGGPTPLQPPQLPQRGHKRSWCLAAQVCPAHGDPQRRHRALWGAQRCCRGLTPLSNPPKVPQWTPMARSSGLSSTQGLWGGTLRGTEVCAGNSGDLRDPWRVVGYLGFLGGSVPGCCCPPPSAGAAQHSGTGPGEWGTSLQSPPRGCTLPAARRCEPGRHSAEESGLGGNQEGSGRAPPPNRSPMEWGTLLGTPSKYRYTLWDPPTINQDPKTGDTPSPQNSDASTRNPTISYQKNGDPLQTRDRSPVKPVPFKPETPKPLLF